MSEQKHVPSSGLSRHQSQFKFVALNPVTKLYLHMSGESETDNKDHRWIGFRKQFKALGVVTGDDNEYELQPAYGKKR